MLLAALFRSSRNEKCSGVYQQKSYSIVILSNEKQQTADTDNGIVESQKYFAAWKPYTEEYVLYGSICRKL